MDQRRTKGILLIAVILFVGCCEAFQKGTSMARWPFAKIKATKPTSRTQCNLIPLESIPEQFSPATIDSNLITMNTQTLASTLSTSSSASWLNINSETAEALAGPFFGASLFPYLAFLYFLNVEENETPKGVTVGFATCLLFVFLTIPAAIAAKLLYGVSLADSDWLHGSAESLLTITNLVTVVAFRQALAAKEDTDLPTPKSSISYAPMTFLVVGLTALAGITALVPALNSPEVHTLYLGGFLDLPFTFDGMGAHPEPANALSVPCWIIHVSSLVEFLVAMGFAWRWGDVVQNPKWKGLTWGLLPLHSSGITACTCKASFTLPWWIPACFIQFFLMLLCSSSTLVFRSLILQPNPSLSAASGTLDLRWKHYSCLRSLAYRTLKWMETGTPSHVGYFWIR